MRSPAYLLALSLLGACAETTGDSDAGHGVAGFSAGMGAGTAGLALPSAIGGASAAGMAAAMAGRSSAGAPAADGGAGRDAGTPPSHPDAGGEADGGAAPDALCDGSSKVRVLFTVSGGFVTSIYGFTNPYGFVFLAVDGTCRFHVSGDYTRGISTGTLTPEEEQQLSAALHWSELDAWADYAWTDDVCPDAGFVTLGKAKAHAGCSCGCDADAPAGLAEALANAMTWIGRLEARGERLTGPVSAVLTRVWWNGSPDSPPVTTVDWPLARAPTAIPNLVFEPNDAKVQTGPYARFEDATEVRRLRELRATVHPPAPTQPVWVRDDANVYQQFVRDELPDAFANGMRALRESWPTP